MPEFKRILVFRISYFLLLKKFNKAKMVGGHKPIKMALSESFNTI